MGELFIKYEPLGCNVNLKILILSSHLDFFHTNLGDVSNEHGETIAANEKRYQGKWNSGKFCQLLLKIDIRKFHRLLQKRNDENNILLM